MTSEEAAVPTVAVVGCSDGPVTVRKQVGWLAVLCATERKLNDATDTLLLTQFVGCLLRSRRCCAVSLRFDVGNAMRRVGDNNGVK